MKTILALLIGMGVVSMSHAQAHRPNFGGVEGSWIKAVHPACEPMKKLSSREMEVHYFNQAKTVKKGDSRADLLSKFGTPTEEREAYNKERIHEGIQMRWDIHRKDIHSFNEECDTYILATLTPKGELEKFSFKRGRSPYRFE